MDGSLSLLISRLVLDRSCGHGSSDLRKREERSEAQNMFWMFVRQWEFTTRLMIRGAKPLWR